MEEQDLEVLHQHATNLIWHGDEKQRDIGELIRELIGEYESLKKYSCNCDIDCDSMDGDVNKDIA